MDRPKEVRVKIEVLGTGCPKCEELARNVETAVNELVNAKLWLAKGEEADKLRDERMAELQAHPSAAQSTPAIGAGPSSGSRS